MPGSSERRHAGEPLGLDTIVRRSEAAGLADQLERVWQSQYGPLGDLNDDLAKLKRYFDPVATGARLRRDLAKVEPVGDVGLLAPPHVVSVGDDRVIVTPEGRVALDALRGGLVRSSDQNVSIGRERLAAGERRLLGLYRSWTRHRIDQVLALQAGDDKPLQVPAIGLLLTLLVNRCDDHARAVVLPAEPERLRAVDRCFIEPAAAFAKALLPNANFKAEKESLYKGWWLGEISRRIPQQVLADRERVYLAPGGRNVGLTLAARELGGRRVDTKSVTEAFDVLVDDFRANGRTLAAFELAYERPSDTARLRADLIDAHERQVA